MQLIGLKEAGCLLADLNMRSMPDCEELWAAIPYAEYGNSELLLFQSAARFSKAIKFFGRIDGTCPIDPKVLQWFLIKQRSTSDVECRLVPHWLHAKVIWWVGVGAYIGSANLTDRAWNQNHEAGIFLTQDELDREGLSERLDMFFDQVAAKSIPLDDDIYKKQSWLHEQREKLRAGLYKLEREFEDSAPALQDRKSPIFETPIRKNFEMRRKRFVAEWQETLAYLRPLAQRVALDENRPDWIPEETPAGVQVDQFLHAYYYQKVSRGKEKDAYLTHYERNRNQPEVAMQEMLKWWKEGRYEHQYEELMVKHFAPAFVEHFARDRLLNLDRETFAQTMARSHAFRMHSSRMSNDELGFDEKPEIEEKILAHGRKLFDTRSKSGDKSALEVFHYVIWGPGDVGERIWTAIHNPNYQLDDVGPSTHGEIVGWVRPNDFPPRNQRTNKAIKALGREIKVG